MKSVRVWWAVAAGIAVVVAAAVATVILRPDPAGPAASAPAASPSAPAVSPAPSPPAVSPPAASPPAVSPPAPAPSGTVRDVRSENAGGRSRDLTFHSPALGRTAKARILLPRGWKPGSGPWPVLYLLHGCCGPDHLGWVEYGGAERLTAGAPVIVVIPEGGPAGFYSDWLRGPRWETFHMTELLGVVEKEYGAGDRRAIAGLSMGGFGAMSYAARHPGAFQAAASFSGVLDPEAGPQGVMGIVRSHGFDPGDLWGVPGGAEDVWAAHNPRRLASALKGVWLYVSCGNGDPGPLDGPGATGDGGEQFLLAEARSFVKRVREAGLSVETDFYGDGTHSWPYWERALERALPGLLEAIGVR
ncbi:alpha/beta hydrolase [Planobispora rosea]|uniref:alpha/beta hydrolase n=1 Tax=Planobispora rosea TaxID=35762 RepID=UPI0009FEBD98|nr:alpha/beta hydrolase family protein [Planobispora rosea]